MLTRREMLALLGAAGLGLAACTPVPAPPSTPPPGADLTAPGEAVRVLNALVSAAGSPTLLKVQLSRSAATVAAVVDTQVQHWSWREAAPRQVDGDTADVGQARFTLDEFNLSDVAGLFTLAAVVAGSNRGQELQIVDYSGARVLMTVSTQPESQPVFFRPDGTLIRPLDLSYAPDLAEGLREATSGLERVTAVGLLPALGMYAELAGHDTVLRQVRGARVPTRSESRPDTSPLLGWDFPPGRVDPDLVVGLATRLGQGRQVAFVADRRDHLADPVLRFVVDGRTSAWDLAGRDVTDRVR